MMDFAALIAGALLFCAGFHMFLLPNAIILGGATGIGTVCELLFGWDVGAVNILLNLPLLALRLRRYGRGGLARSVLGILSVSVAIDVFSFLPSLTGEPLIAAAFGGAVCGAGTAVALLRGYTSGGSDLAAYLLHGRFRRLSLGSWVFCIDAAIVLTSAVLLSSFSGIFYSVVALLCYSFALDGILSHVHGAQLALLICPEIDAQRLTEGIAASVDRGVTLLRGNGGYTGQGKSVLLCAVRRRESDRLLTAVRAICPIAFLVFLSAPRVIGARFPEETVDNLPAM